MKEYKVISPFVERDEEGTITGNRPQIGDTVTLSNNEGERLKKALCVVEARIVKQPENRKVNSGTKNSKRINRRTSNDKRS